MPERQLSRAWTLVIPGAARRAVRTSAGTGPVGAMIIIAEPGSTVRPTSMSAMLIPAFAEQRADDADHARAVVVAHDEQVIGDRDLGGVVVDQHDAAFAAPPGERRRQIECPPPRKVTQVDVVAAAVEQLTSRTSVPCCFGQLRGVDVGDRFVADQPRRSP